MGGAIGPAIGKVAGAALSGSPIVSGLSALSGGGLPSMAGPQPGSGVMGVSAGNPFSRVFDALGAASGQVASAPQLGADPSSQVAASNIASLPPAPTGGIANVPNQAVGGQRKYEPLARQYAQKWGVDPNVAVRVLNAEGGLDDWIQSKVPNKHRPGQKEPSYGPGQFLVGGGDTGMPMGLGNRFIKDTGLDPRNPANAEPYFDYMMKEVSQRGWGQWYGAKAAGVGNFDGVGGRPANGHNPMLDQVQGGVAYSGNPAGGGAPVVGGGMAGGIDVPGMSQAAGGQQQAPSALERVLSSLGKSKGVAPGAQQAESAEIGPAVDLGEQEIASTQQALTQRRLGGGNASSQQRKASIRQRVGYKS